MSIKYPEHVDGSSLTGPRAIQPGERPVCVVHQRPMVCPSCIGAAGGKRRSERKTMTARLNAMRPRPGRSLVRREASSGRFIDTEDTTMVTAGKGPIVRSAGRTLAAAARKTSPLAAAKKRAKAGKRTLLKGTASGDHYIRRRKDGTIKSEVSVGKSLAADRRKKATTKVKKGQGDKGDV